MYLTILVPNLRTITVLKYQQVRGMSVKFVNTANFNKTSALLQVLVMIYYFIINYVLLVCYENDNFINERHIYHIPRLGIGTRGDRKKKHLNCIFKIVVCDKIRSVESSNPIKILTHGSA